LVDETGSYELFKLIKKLIKILRNCSEVFLQLRKLIGQHFSERFYWHDCKIESSYFHIQNAEPTDNSRKENIRNMKTSGNSQDIDENKM
jgi:hypothetical protein